MPIFDYGNEIVNRSFVYESFKSIAEIEVNFSKKASSFSKQYDFFMTSVEYPAFFSMNGGYLA